MDTTGRSLTTEQQDRALAFIAAWLGPRMGYDGPAPTGESAAYRAEGPMLHRAWDWPSDGPVPTILLEGGPDDWAVAASLTTSVINELAQVGVYAEPYAGYALCLYPA
jgi:hypothetical protein